MTKILVGYTTNSGSTAEVAEAIGEELSRLGLEVDVRTVEVHALAETGEGDAVHGVAVVGEALASAFPFPSTGGGAVDDDKGLLRRGVGGEGRDSGGENGDKEQGCESD